MTDFERSTEIDETSELRKKFQAGDLWAFNVLFERYRQDLYRVVRRRLGSSYRGRIDPSDVIQEARIDAMRRMGDYLARRPMPFRDWLLRTAIQRLLKLRRHASAACRNVTREQQLGQNDESADLLTPKNVRRVSTPSELLAAHDLTRLLHAGIDRLSEIDRQIIGMRALENLSYECVGSRLGINAATARKRYGRALLRLRGLLLADGLKESQL